MTAVEEVNLLCNTYKNIW
jgi:hypothetical protein